MPEMNTAIKMFTDYMDKKDVHYTVEDEDRVRIVFNGKNMPSISLRFIFGDDGRDVAIRVFSIAKVPDNKIKDTCVVCSKLNSRFRWIKFYLDRDNEVTASDDAVLDPYTTGEECFELLLRSTDIVDKAYPEIMRSLWS